VLTVLAGLGADRPENPLLIRQGGALWLREDTAGRQEVTVFAGPTDQQTQTDGADQDAAGIHYWVDQSGLAHRVDVRLGEEWAEVTLEDATLTVPAVLKDVDPSALPDTRRNDG
jgi:hypothetical protein